MFQATEKGFVIIFAVLISALMLLIGVGIFRISVKETVLSSTARESTIAFFAADGGLECALQEAVQGTGFIASGDMQCGEESFSYTNNAATPTVDIRGIVLPQGCAWVEFNPSHEGGSYTLIRSHGYNVCDGDGMPDTEDPLLLERVLELKYPNS